MSNDQKVMYQWKDLVIKHMFPSKINYIYTPLEPTDWKLITFIPIVLNLSETDDPKHFNYIELELEGCLEGFVIGLMKEDNENQLGSDADSFGIDTGGCKNNNYTSQRDNWHHKSQSLKIGLWFNAHTKNLVVYKFSRLVLNRWDCNVAFEGCIIDATRNWVLAGEFRNRQTCSVS
jgi:hypothetical protein